MIVRVSDVADIQGGLVLSRKEARHPDEDLFRYKRLTLRALDEYGIIHDDELEEFFAREELDPALFTKNKDVLIRLFYPLCPVLVDESKEKLLMPSQLAALRIKNELVLPGYLSLYLAQKEIQDRIQKIESGSMQRAVKISTIMNLPIVLPDMETQRKVIQIDTLRRNKEQMYKDLIEQERILTQSVIGRIIGGTEK